MECSRPHGIAMTSDGEGPESGRTTPPAAIPSCASRSSWRTWAGLIAAVDRYNPDYSTPFVPRAMACVVGELPPPRD
jgi:hypothetical protein